MHELPQLPDLDAMPSVLEVAEVNEVLAQIIAAAEKNPTVSRNAAADMMVDAIFAQGYRPDEPLDATLSAHIFRWIQVEWKVGDESFAEAAITVCANLSCSGITQYLRRLLEEEQRVAVREELRMCLREFAE